MEFDWKPVPLTMSQKVELPAITAFGVTKVTAGTGLSVVPVVLELVEVQALKNSMNEVRTR
jgi:hypothetical protein